MSTNRSFVDTCLHAHKVAIGIALSTTKGEFVQLYEITVARPLCLVLALTLLAGCGGSSGPAPPTPAPVSAGNLNLISDIASKLTIQ
jgi:hypothetical protein